MYTVCAHFGVRHCEWRGCPARLGRWDVLCCYDNGVNRWFGTARASTAHVCVTRSYFGVQHLWW
ncbi:hypothetical protein CERZMDRAFT_89880 [Cercospora zeae-maydis SCOH1-5]|uniref:Uncharacterized protein n=1 Tax=Cercospora zeae-maydis SCOH1-5 TaxID=717836 RepID=A0A6A6FSQ3_9PEZI|nr:hypothetical protein CERZMDRAFT_89880 [Cercospora zeae-maydis SCOH1-5]